MHSSSSVVSKELPAVKLTHFPDVSMKCLGHFFFWEGALVNIRDGHSTTVAFSACFYSFAINN